MAKVFMSYRRDDSAGHAGRLFDSLESRFDRSGFFRDIDSIGAGVDFRTALDRALAACDAMLVVIGPRWSSSRNEEGRRLEQADDLVRIEVATALASDRIRTYPVLVGGAELPTAKELPDDLKALTRRNALEISDSRWRYDVRRLGDTLQRDLGLQETKRSSGRLLKWGAAALVVVAAALGFLFMQPGPVDPLSESEDSAQSLIGDAGQADSGAPGADPQVLAIGEQVLRNLDATSNQGSGFDYWPDGGIQIAYFHLRTFTSYAEIADLAPVPVFLSGPHSETSLNFESKDEFGHYNPEFLSWAKVQVDALLANDELVESTRTLFNAYLGKPLRAYWDTVRIMLEHPGEFQALVDDYRERIDEQRVPRDYYYNAAWNGRDFLESIRRLDEMHSINVVAPAVYFWARREIDGTLEPMMQTLGDVLLAFGTISAVDVLDAQDTVDFDSGPTFDDPDSMRSIRDRINQIEPDPP